MLHTHETARTKIQSRSNKQDHQLLADPEQTDQVLVILKYFMCLTSFLPSDQGFTLPASATAWP